MKYSAVLAAIVLTIVTTSALSAQSTRPAVNLPKVDLNAGTETALASLPSVGDALAKKIIAARPYGSVEELAKAGIGAAKIEQIRPFVTVGDKSPATATRPLVRGPLEGPGVTPVPIESGTVRVVPVPEGAVTTIPVRGNTVKATPAGSGIVRVKPDGSNWPVPPAGEAGGKSGSSAAPSASGLVWADMTKKVFHRQGSAGYGMSQPGRVMTEGAAIAAGYHEGKPGPAPTTKTPASSTTKKKSKN